MKIKSSKIVHSNRPRAFRRVFRCQPNAYNIRFTVIYVVFLPIQKQHTPKRVLPVEIYTPRPSPSCILYIIMTCDIRSDDNNIDDDQSWDVEQPEIASINACSGDMLGCVIFRGVYNRSQCGVTHGLRRGWIGWLTIIHFLMHSSVK